MHGRDYHPQQPGGPRGQLQARRVAGGLGTGEWAASPRSPTEGSQVAPCTDPRVHSVIQQLILTEQAHSRGPGLGTRHLARPLMASASREGQAGRLSQCRSPGSGSGELARGCRRAWVALASNLPAARALPLRRAGTCPLCLPTPFLERVDSCSDPWPEPLRAEWAYGNSCGVSQALASWSPSRGGVCNLDPCPTLTPSSPWGPVQLGACWSLAGAWVPLQSTQGWERPGSSCRCRCPLRPRPRLSLLAGLTAYLVLCLPLWSRRQASCRPLLHLPCPPRRPLLLAVLIPVAAWAGLLPSVLHTHSAMPRFPTGSSGAFQGLGGCGRVLSCLAGWCTPVGVSCGPAGPPADWLVLGLPSRPVAALLHLFLPRFAPRSHPTLLKSQSLGQHHPRRERHDPTGTAEGLWPDRWTTWEPPQGPLGPQPSMCGRDCRRPLDHDGAVAGNPAREGTAADTSPQHPTPSSEPLRRHRDALHACPRDGLDPKTGAGASPWIETHPLTDGLRRAGVSLAGLTPSAYPLNPET